MKRLCGYKKSVPEARLVYFRGIGVLKCVTCLTYHFRKIVVNT